MSRTRSSPLLLGVLLAAASAAVLLSAFAAGFLNSQADEVVLAWTAKQALLGQTPYVDYFCFYPPLSVWGLKLFFGVFGASLGALRLLTVAWLVGTTLLFYAALLKMKVPSAWAGATSFLFPALVVPFWPIPSHHWFALGAGLAALLMVVGRESAGGFRWFLSGLLACLAGLCLQTDGLLFALLVLLHLPIDRGARSSLRALVWFAIGAFLPVTIAVAFLWQKGVLAAAWDCLVVWPRRYYKQPGGFNDVHPAAALSEELRARLPESWASRDALDFVTFLFGLFLAPFGLLSLAFSPAWLTPARLPSAAYVRSLLGGLLVIFFYLSGRSDWVHLVLYLPVLIFCVVPEIDWKGETWRPLFAKALLSLLTAWALVRWPAHWIHEPPLVRRVLEADARFARQSPVGILNALPELTKEKRPVVYMPYGSSLYFFWAPDPPPIDWIMPPSSKHDGPRQYRDLAAYLDAKSVPYVLIRDDMARKFFEEPSAVSEVLNRSYVPIRKTPWGTLFRREAEASAATGEGPSP